MGPIDHPTFYVYENRPTNRATIHAAECRSANYGRGVHNVGNTRNGRWLGPYESRETAYEVARGTGRKVKSCARCP